MGIDYCYYCGSVIDNEMGIQLCDHCISKNKISYKKIDDINSHIPDSRNRTDEEYSVILKALEGRPVERCVDCHLQYYILDESVDPFIGDDPNDKNSVPYIELAIRPSHVDKPTSAREWICTRCLHLDHENHQKRSA